MILAARYPQELMPVRLWPTATSHLRLEQEVNPGTPSRCRGQQLTKACEGRAWSLQSA